MSDEKQPLKCKLHDGEHWFYLYDCGHITAKNYPPSTVIPAGDHANILLCRHCWQHVTGMAAEDILKDLLRQRPAPEVVEAIKRILGGEFNDRLAA